MFKDHCVKYQNASSSIIGRLKWKLSMFAKHTHDSQIIVEFKCSKAKNLFLREDYKTEELG